MLTGGKDYREPLWWETAKLAFYTRRGVACFARHVKAAPSVYAEETDELCSPHRARAYADRSATAGPSARPSRMPGP